MVLLPRQNKNHWIFFLIILGSLSQNYVITIKGEDAIPITSNEEFFTTAIDFYALEAESYRLEVVGHVYNPLSLTLEEIKALPVTSEIVRLTCIAYKYGASSLTGVANWTGVKLSEVLNLAQIDFNTAVDVIFRTPDHSGYSGPQIRRKNPESIPRYRPRQDCC